jgi:hypothetical protein
VELTEAFRLQAWACGEMGSPMYAELLTRATEDLAAGGVVREVLRGFEDDPEDSATGLRLLGSVHRLVLERRAGALAAYYPSVGGTFEPEGAWRELRALLEEQPAAVREWLDRPPQTNEVGRAGALYGGLLHLPGLGLEHLPLRLVELGASAGLNLRADRFTYLDAAGRRFGAEDSPVVLADAWHGRRLADWPRLQVEERIGCDLRPVDPTTTEGRLLLTAYVWPDQRARLERLRAAFQVAADLPVEVRREAASSLLDRLELCDGATTVVWHSVVWQYLSTAERAAVSGRLAELAATATHDRPLVHLRAEPHRRGERVHEFLVTLASWPGGEERVVGRTVGHGLPTTWE